MYKNQMYKKSAVVFALILLINLFAAGFVFANDVNVVDDFAWVGNGSENATCDGINADWHWILTPGGNNQFVTGTLYVTFTDDTQLSATGYFPGGDRGAMHFNILRADGGTVESAYVDFTYEGSPGGNFVLTISSLECEDADDEDGTGDLVITKTAFVLGDDDVRTPDDIEYVDFSFKVTDANNVEQTFTLVNGESKTITLPTGSYSVEETDSTEYYDVDEASFNGTITVDETETVTFVNVREEGTIPPPPPSGNGDGELTITKKAYVTVNGGERTLDEITNVEFTFVVTGEDFEETYKLMNGGSTTIVLPAGLYTVEETNAAGYVAEQATFNVTIVEGETETVDFVNVRNEETTTPPPPGGNGEDEEDDDETLPVTSGMDGLLLLLGAGVTGSGLLIRRRNRK